MVERFETYSFLPPPSSKQIDEHIDYIIEQKLTPIIEYSEDIISVYTFWHMWHLPKGMELSKILVQKMLNQCVHNNPMALVRLSGYDPKSRCNQISFIAKAPQE